MRQWTDDDGQQWRANEAGGYVAVQRLSADGRWLALDSHGDKLALWDEVARLDGQAGQQTPPNVRSAPCSRAVPHD